MKNWLIPHPNVPNAEFGDAHLKRVTTLFNENFAKLDALMQSAQSSVSSLESSKSNDGHKHDEEYAQLEHKHVPDDVTGLSDLLDNKANLNHEHAQYLTEITAHQHETNEINGLLEALNGKAPTAHGHTFADVDGLDDLSASAARTAYVDYRDAEKLAAAKAYTDAQISGIDVPEASSMTPYKDTEDGKTGTATSFARGDHQHELNYPEGKPTTNLRADGMGPDHGASFGDTNSYADLGHSHPLNFDPQKTATALAPDGNGNGGTPQFGNSNYYADMFHSHPLNVASRGNPSDVVKSTGSASPGSSTRYARHDHVHKMPALTGDDIVYAGTTSVSSQIQTNVQSITTNTNGLSDHERRIETLEARPSGGSVTSVDNISPVNGNVSLANDETLVQRAMIGQADGVQSYSSKLTNLDATLNDDGTMPVSNVYETGCTKVCLAICDKGEFGHSNSGLGASGQFVADDFGGDWPALRAMSQCFTKVGNALRVMFSKITGGSQNSNKVVTTDAEGNVATNDPGDGLQLSSGTLSAKCATNGGLTADADGLALNPLTENSWVKTDANGLPTVSPDNPVTLASGIVWTQMFSSQKQRDENVLYFSPPVFDANGKLTGFGEAVEIFRAYTYE